MIQTFKHQWPESSPHWAWYQELRRLARSGDKTSLMAGFTGIGRRFGHQSFMSDKGEWWRLSDWLRTELLKLWLAERADEQKALIVEELFRRGDLNEQVAVLRSLPVIDQNGFAVETAVSALRTHATDVFSAIALCNPYPAKFFSKPQFRQMILKCLFLNLDLSKVAGWERFDNELARMAQDYKSERQVAGRPVPPGCDQIIQFVAQREEGEKLI